MDGIKNKQHKGLMTTTPAQAPPRFLNRHRLSLATGVSFNQITNAIMRGHIYPDGMLSRDQPLFLEERLSELKQTLHNLSEQLRQ